MTSHHHEAAGHGDEHDYVDDFLAVRDAVAPLRGWRHLPEEMWCYVTPPDSEFRAQGWKIHVSATPRSAVPVLRAASRVLLEHKAAFKFAKSLSRLRMLLSIRMDRGAGGKFITVYPSSDEQFTDLLQALHRATEGLEGPAILSDRRYLPDSLVHYRYGGFSAGQQVLDVDGAYVPMLVAPDGSWSKDERTAWFSPPPWASAPRLPEGVEQPGPVRRQRSKGQVLLNDRFVVFEAIRHSNRGGVYRALDRHDGDRRVIIKEARPFVAAETCGTDARDYLRNEYRTLSLLEPLGIAVKPVDLFEYQGHSFMAEEEVPGVPLRDWVAERIRNEPSRALPLDAVLPVARRVVALAGAAHDKGLVLRDFTPNNIMVTPGGELVLIDTEFAAIPGETTTRIQTPSYTAPEEIGGPTRYPAPSHEADLYSVGATLFYLCTGVNPVVANDGFAAEPGRKPPVRPHDERVERMVAGVAADVPSLAALAPAVLGLMREDPTRRTGLVQVLDLLDTPRVPVPAAAPHRLSAADRDRLLADGTAQLVAAMTPESRRSLWPAPPMEGRQFDTLAVQAGSGGTLEVLRRAALRAEGAEGGERLAGGELTEALRTALTWLDRHADDERRQLPGLYFGRAGTYWAMYEAAAALGEEEIGRRSVDRAKRLSVNWTNPDMTHGMAGNGLAQLRLWRRTGDEEFRVRAELCVEAVLGARSEDGTTWPVPAAMGQVSGLTHYGFAHGVAGVGAFLVVAARELGRPDLLDIATSSGDLLLSLARRQGESLAWPTAQHEPEDAEKFDGVCWWCSGAPGIGTFLIRLWRATGEDRFLEAAHGAAVATRRERWLLLASHCHGVAGNGEFLLDMAAATGERRYRDWAAEHAASLYRLSALHEGRLVVLDETNSALTYSYGVGMAGAIGFLHRHRHGGERWWMVDDFTLEPEGESR
ncbi:class IV lanthionine synthetase LanL [Streptomyces marincola]|uniref:class IV lanthionine synthetase LanL n=1 Tax=Streptomyces marincola TaxID=2878388 RepID=UPI001CF5DA58|nr:class IV lanthionine synthetase LanL [Streptomyces marincola]UCM88136.1 class IV lanthionine synthetase LanL [Streptomyces marincola]